MIYEYSPIREPTLPINLNYFLMTRSQNGGQSVSEFPHFMGTTCLYAQEYYNRFLGY